jgi:hypothetical protein
MLVQESLDGMEPLQYAFRVVEAIYADGQAVVVRDAQALEHLRAAVGDR